MSNEFLTTLQAAWASLPSDVQAIVTGWAGELAATLSANVIGGLSRALQRQIAGTPAEQALEEAFAEGLRACVAVLALPDAWREERYRAALAYFLGLDEVADEFAALVDVRPGVELDVGRLRELFEADGRELAQLPGLDFEAAMRAFALAYCDAVERSGVQQHLDQLRYLKQIVAQLEDVHLETALSREELVRVREAVGAVQRALERRLAEQVRVFQEAMAVYRSFPEEAAGALRELASRIAELSQAILGTVRQDAETFRQADLETKEAAYRILIASEFERLDFRGMLQHGQPVTLPLERVYVSLRAAQRVPTADTLEMERLRRQLAEDDARRAEGEPPHMDDERRAELERQLDERQRTRWQREAEPVDLQASLADRDNLGMVILGDPGAGKTTLLKHLALVFARDAAPAKLKLEERRLPIFLPFAFYDTALAENPNLSLGDYLASYYASERNLPGLKPLFDTALREGRAIVLLDGLDEVLEPEIRSRVGRRAEAFVRQETARGNRVLLTSRIVGYRGVELRADLPHFTILDMAPAAVHAFVERWALALTCQVRGEPFEMPTVEAREKASELATGLKGAIESAESVRRLAVNPLLLTILAVVYTQEGMALPRRRVELYDRYARILIETWRRARTAGRFVGKEMEFLPTAKILGPLALWLQGEYPSGTAPGPCLWERLGCIFLERMGWQPGQRPDEELEMKTHHQTRDFMADVREFAGVLVEQGRDTYGFLHLTFQEYFAAWWLAKMDPAERLACLGPHLHDPRWREAILLTAGHLGVIEGNERQVSNFVEAILNADSPVPELHRDLLLAAACLADDVGVRLDLGQEIVGQLSELLRGPVPALAWDAGEVLEKLAETSLAVQAVDAALTLLQKETNWWNRHAAVGSLGRLRRASPKAVGALIAALADSGWDVREAAAGSLGELAQASPQVIDALIAALGDSSWSVREAAARSLGQLGQTSPTVVEALLSALSDSRFRVREAGARGLGQLGQASPKVVEELIAALVDNEWPVRLASRDSLRQLSHTIPSVVQKLLVTLCDNDWRLRQAAAGSLGRLGRIDPQIIEALIDALADSSWGVRQVAARSLSKLGFASPAVVEALMATFDDHSFSVRQAAACSLAQMGVASSEVIEILTAALAGRDERIREAVARSLGQLGTASLAAVEALIIALDAPSFKVRRAAAGSLGQLGQAPSQGIEALIAALADHDDGVRNTALMSLSRLSQRSPVVIQRLIAALTDCNWRIREAATRSLGHLNLAQPGVIESLISALADDSWHVREAAAVGLGRLGQVSPEVIDGLTAALADNDWRVRRAAAGALGRLGQVSSKVVKILSAGLADSYWGVRRAVVRSLGELGQKWPKILVILISVLEDGDFRVRDAAYQALLALAPKMAGWVQDEM